FQADDGIRDRNVTGVQTCALPIFALVVLLVDLRGRAGPRGVGGVRVALAPPRGGPGAPSLALRPGIPLVGLRVVGRDVLGAGERSEEARVGNGGGTKLGFAEDDSK